MKKSEKVTLTLCAAAAAAAISGCNRILEAQVERCVDDQSITVEDRNCEMQPSSRATGSRYRWVYGGNGGYTAGSMVYGASPEPTDGLSIVRGSQLAARGYSEGGARVGITEGGAFTSPPSARGGFGSSGHAFGGEGHGAGE